MIKLECTLLLVWFGYFFSFVWCFKILILYLKLFFKVIFKNYYSDVPIFKPNDNFEFTNICFLAPIKNEK